MVVMEAFGLAAAELFAYNRENFQYDNEQRIERDINRVKMQIERFNLFREDIEDLVKLTVGKMDMYHLVGALVLGSATTMFTEGRIYAPTPPFFLSIYFMSLCGGWLYLLMTVWLSMYASVSSHSFGTRLRTRYVRLPIPSLEQLYGIASKLHHFEHQGADKILRVPFGPQGTPEWRQVSGMPASSQKPSNSTAVLKSGRTPDSSNSRTAVMRWNTEGEDLLGSGEAAFGREEVVTSAASAATGKHVQRFRQLQAKWQCFDAYARVSMTLGVHQILQSLNYFLLGLTLVENATRSTAIVLTVILQSLCLAILVLDLAGLSTLQVIAMQMVASVPVFIILCCLATGERRATHLLNPNEISPAVPIACFFEALWFQLVLLVSKPSDGLASLPRRFRAVLFLDVFGDAAYDPTYAEHETPPEEESMPSREEQEILAAAADRAVMTAQAALRRWEALPEEHVSSDLSEQLWQLRREHTIWRKALMNYFVQQKSARGTVFDVDARDDEDLRPWEDLSDVEKEEDEFSGTLVGPLGQPGPQRSYCYDLSTGRIVLERERCQAVLTLREVAAHVDLCKAAVQRLLASRDSVDNEESFDRQQSSDDDEHVGLVKRFQRHNSLTDFFGLNPTSKVDRLPWKLLRRLTHSLQISWIFLGVSQALSCWWPGRFGPDILAQVSSDTDEGATIRRLSLRSGLATTMSDWSPNFANVEISWPHRSFLKPTGVICKQDRFPLLANGSATNWSGTAELQLTSPYIVYQMKGSPELLFVDHVVPNPHLGLKTTSFCYPDSHPSRYGGPSCWQVSLNGNGHAASLHSSWNNASFSSNARLSDISFGGHRPWKLLSGSFVSCVEILAARNEAVSATWCIILVGWDGEEMPVVVLPLTDGPRSSFETSLVYSWNLKLQPLSMLSSGRNDVAALHLRADALQTWVLSETNGLRLIDLLSGKTVGHWIPRWAGCPHRQGKSDKPSFDQFLPLAFCEMTSPLPMNDTHQASRTNHLFVVGRSFCGTDSIALQQVLLPEWL